MKKTLFRVMSVFLAVAMMFVIVQVAAFAQDEENVTELSIISSNVSGLPIPSAFSDKKRVVPTAQTEIGKILNSSGADVICVQEDFQFHFMLAKEMTNYTYQTYTSGGVPAGDGLNIFSKYPIYNVERVAWDEFYGVLTDANDGLTPKGLLKCTIDVDGVLLDVYNIHIDAYGSGHNQMAKKAQFIQLSEYIAANSADRPVVVTGDMNCTLHTDYLADFYQTMIVGAGFEDAWVNVVNGGNYLRGSDAQQIIDDYFARYNNCYWGIWDSVERTLYRNGNGATVTPISFTYEQCTNDPEQPEAFTDHNLMKCTLQLDTSEYAKPDMELATQVEKSLVERITYGAKMVARCLLLIIGDALRLLGEKIA